MHSKNYRCHGEDKKAFFLLSFFHQERKQKIGQEVRILRIAELTEERRESSSSMLSKLINIFL